MPKHKLVGMTRFTDLGKRSGTMVCCCDGGGDGSGVVLCRCLTSQQHATYI